MKLNDCNLFNIRFCHRLQHNQYLSRYSRFPYYSSINDSTT